jgi:ElaA protein
LSELIRSAALAEVPPERLYRILQLRSAVFVMEQECPFLDPDGRDLEPGAVQWWVEDGEGRVLSCLRVLPGAPAAAGREAGSEVGNEIGRVVTAPAARHRGLGGRLVAAALATCARPVAINAQTRLVPWYETFGFVRSGPDFLEDGQPHTPMQME